MAFEQPIFRFFQLVYDYLLDRYDVRVGSFRLAFASAVFGKDVLAMAVKVETAADAASFAMACAINVAILYAAFARNHFRENDDQRDQKFLKLNHRALRFQAFWLFRLGLLALGVLVCRISTGVFVTWSWLASFVLLLGWMYALGVTVRERDGARFKKTKLAFDAA